MPGAVPYTSTMALCNATFKYVKEIANNGLDSFKTNTSLLKGLNVYKGHITYKGVSDAFDLEYSPAFELLSD